MMICKGGFTMNKKKVLLIVGIVCLSIIVFASILTIITMFIMNHTATLEYYDVSGEKIPTVYSVLGKRNVSYISVGNKNDVHYQEYKYYGMDSASNDVEEYILFLCNEQGFTLYDNFERSQIEGEVRLGKKLDSGKEIMITITYQIGSYTVLIQNT